MTPLWEENFLENSTEKSYHLPIQYRKYTIYFLQNIQQPEKEEFAMATVKEVSGNFKKKHWKLVTKDKFPKGGPILDAVWSINLKHDFKTGKVYKWKSGLNLNGQKQ